MQAAVQVTSPQICSCADLCVLQQSMKFHCSTGKESRTKLHCNFMEKITQWFISRPSTSQKGWKANSVGVFNLF